MFVVVKPKRKQQQNWNDKVKSIKMFLFLIFACTFTIFVCFWMLLNNRRLFLHRRLTLRRHCMQIVRVVMAVL